jgi:hypothetical protein
MSEIPFTVEPSRTILLNVNNSGKKDFLDNAKMDMIGEDRIGNIIFASSIMIGSIRMGESFNIEFTNLIRPSIWHRLCKARFLIDTKYQIAEENKENNESIVNLGMCEDPYSYNDGGRIDFRPWIKKENDKLILYFFNVGNISFNVGERVKFTFMGRGLETKENRFSRDIVGEILPFGDFTTYEINKDFIAGKCHFEVHVNPYFRVNESNYFNNIFELDICN